MSLGAVVCGEPTPRIGNVKEARRLMETHFLSCDVCARAGGELAPERALCDVGRGFRSLWRLAKTKIGG